MRLPPGADENIEGQPPISERREDGPTADLAQSALDAVPGHGAPTMLRHDEAQAGKGSGGRRQEDLEVLGPLALPPLQESADLTRVPDAGGAREALPGPRVGSGYLLPTDTMRRARPFFRRRERVARPPRVFIRARNPCLFTRLRLRGLYVGFIADSPIHESSSFRNELEKIIAPPGTRQPDALAALWKAPGAPAPTGRIDFSTPRS